MNKPKHLLSLTLVAISALMLVSVFGQGGTGSRGQRQQDFTGQDVLGGDFTPHSITLTDPSATGKLGYSTGAGCAVTQASNRTTGVTCTGLSGAITTNNASLAAEATADFTVTDTSVAVGDVVVVSIRSGSNGGGTIVSVSTVAAGSFAIRVHNGNVASGTAETGAIIINFAVIKAVSA